MTFGASAQVFAGRPPPPSCASHLWPVLEAQRAALAEVRTQLENPFHYSKLLPAPEAQVDDLASNLAESEAESRMITRQGGERKPPNLPSVRLSLENGRQKLSMIRLSLANGPLSAAVISDFVDLLHLVPNLRLLVIGANAAAVQTLKRATMAVTDGGNRVRIVPGQPGHVLTLWSQDDSKPIEGEGFATLVFHSMQGEPLAQVLSNNGIRPVHTPLRLQGGDILVGDRHVFINGGALLSVARSLGISRSSLTQKLAESFGKPILPIGIPTRLGLMPWTFHLDLDLVVAVDRRTDKEIVLVRSPLSLLRTVAASRSRAPVSIVEIDSLRATILANAEAQLAKGQVLTPGMLALVNTFKNITSEMVLADELKSQYVRGMLTAHGYLQRDIPGYGFIDAVPAQDFFLGTNAVLSEYRALVPWNDFPVLDARIRKTYAHLGYKVVAMRSSVKTICIRGAIRCLSETYREQVKLP